MQTGNAGAPSIQLQRRDQRALHRTSRGLAAGDQLIEHRFDPLEVREPLTNILQLALGQTAGGVAARAVIQLQQFRDLVETETQALRGLDEANTRQIDRAIAPNAGRRPGGCAGLDLLLEPLVLITLGFSGAWIGNLSALAPWRPLFIGTALVALVLAYRRIWRPAAACAPGEVCAVPPVKRVCKFLFGVVVVLVCIALGFPCIAPRFY